MGEQEQEWWKESQEHLKVSHSSQVEVWVKASHQESLKGLVQPISKEVSRPENPFKERGRGVAIPSQEGFGLVSSFQFGFCHLVSDNERRGCQPVAYVLCCSLYVFFDPRRSLFCEI